MYRGQTLLVESYYSMLCLLTVVERLHTHDMTAGSWVPVLYSPIKSQMTQINVHTCIFPVVNKHCFCSVHVVTRLHLTSWCVCLILVLRLLDCDHSKTYRWDLTVTNNRTHMWDTHCRHSSLNSKRQHTKTLVSSDVLRLHCVSQSVEEKTLLLCNFSQTLCLLRGNRRADWNHQRRQIQIFESSHEPFTTRNDPSRETVHILSTDRPQMHHQLESSSSSSSPSSI